MKQTRGERHHACVYNTPVWALRRADRQRGSTKSASAHPTGPYLELILVDDGS
jgi:hypothetical protein